MKIFLSWSKPRSQVVAATLHKFLRRVLQHSRPWYSTKSIRSGRLGYQELVDALASTSVGILCVTADNLESRWLNFEAGALLKNLDDSRIIPFLLDVTPAQLGAPLNMFQARTRSRVDVFELITDLNQLLGANALQQEELIETFNVWWPGFEHDLEGVPPSDEAPLQDPDQLDLTQQIFNMVSGLVEQTWASKQFENASIAGISHLIRATSADPDASAAIELAQNAILQEQLKAELGLVGMSDDERMLIRDRLKWLAAERTTLRLRHYESVRGK